MHNISTYIYILREIERDCVGMETINPNVSNAVVAQFKMVPMR